MADAGYRSIEVSVINNSQAALTVRAAQVRSIETSWITNETPNVGDVIPQYEGALWGVSTDNPAVTVSGFVTLLGYGNGPVAIDFTNDLYGNSTVSAVGNDKIITTVSQIQTQAPFHTIFQVKLEPVQAVVHSHAVALRGLGHPPPAALLGSGSKKDK
ncbi:hypothetical protein D7W79_09750 [Corallococcus exercitus]|uniref:hypothetical protein n=1 Tax=Corallococcus exercitus TaxID=2316736 RepID=UPI000EA21A1C|nr:hypothetical protein [Corallococcus exercitus]RKG79675.1 hypothetical protein D7W79_09750 [Corallococcus exercitus]